MSFFKRILTISTILFLHFTASAVTTSYVSADDEDITLKSVIVTPGKDNVQSIYSKPLSEYLITLIEKDRFLEYRESPTPTSAFDLDELRSQPQQTSGFLSKLKADGLIHLQISKGQMGLRFELSLFTKSSGKIWGYADQLETENFDLEKARDVVQKLYTQILGQIPYQGLLLSRQGTKVTVNRGSLAQVQPDQEINVIQVVGVQRHPQFQFVTQVHKEIIGRIRITKVDESLSFGLILFEKEPQSLQPGLKLLLREPVYYPNLATSKNEAVVEHLLTRTDSSVIMQGDSKEWLPQDPPTFGRAHVLFGMGQFGASTTLSTSGGQQGSTILALNAQVDADLWITRSWFLRAGLNQGSAQVTNPLANSTPSKLNFSLQMLKVSAGFDLEVSESVYGPRLQALMGYSQFSSLATESTPTSFTSTVFNGVGFGLSGYMPWEEYESKWGFGAEMWYHLLPSVTETPVTSGSSRNTHILELTASSYYHWRPNIYWMGKVSVDSFKTSFSGSGTRTIEQASSSDFAWTRINAGIEYLF